MNLESQISYRYGFNGMESDDEVKGAGNSYDFGARMYDARVGRFLSLDPISKLSTEKSMYTFAGNSPILFKDFMGKFQFPAGQEQFYKDNYPRLYNYVKNEVEDIANNPHMMKTMARFTGLSEKEIKEALVYGEGPVVQVKFIPLKSQLSGKRPQGVFNLWKQKRLTLDVEMIQKIENAEPADRESSRLLMGVVLIHEFVHYGENETGDDYPGEEGNDWEIATYGKRVYDFKSAQSVIDEYKKRHKPKNATEIKEVKVTPRMKVDRLPFKPIERVKKNNDL